MKHKAELTPFEKELANYLAPDASKMWAKLRMKQVDV